MANTMTKIASITAANSTTNTFTFTSIPQIYVDLLLLCSTRDTLTPSPTTNGVDEFIYFNGAQGTTLFSETRIYGNGSVAGTDRSSNSGYPGITLTTNTSLTSNVFGSNSLYLSQYTNTSNFKSYIADGVSENNGSVAWQTMYAGLWRSTSAVTSLSIVAGAFFAAGSEFTLYGI